MAHIHASPSGRENQREALKKALWITLAFMVIEALGGWISNSLALLADATHMATDAAALAFAWLVSWISARPKTSRMSFGYHRAEVLGGLASALVVTLLSGGIILESFRRFTEANEVKAEVMIFVALLGLFSNLVVMKILHPVKGSNFNLRAAFLHVMSDLMGSLAAVIAGILILYRSWTFMDPLVSLILAGLILWGAWSVVREAVHVLMEGTPPGIHLPKVAEKLKNLTGVEQVHDLHIWTVGSGLPALSVHLVCPRPEGVLVAAQKLLQEEFQIVHTTIQIEKPQQSLEELKCMHCGH